MAILATSAWYIRAGGNELNGGGYDPTLTGGSNQCDADAAALVATDLATPAANSTTLTSATGGFTAAMIGNAIRIASGTNFTAGYYFITARTDTNTVTLDRTPSPAGAGSGGTGRVGGAWPNTRNLLNASPGTLHTAPAIATPLAAGHTVYVRGNGGNPDYNWSTGYVLKPNGNTTAGIIRWIGYGPSTPVIHYDGLIFHNLGYETYDNFHFKCIGSSLQNYGALYASDFGVLAFNSKFDQNGNDSVLVTIAGALNCEFINTGSVAAGIRSGVTLVTGYGVGLRRCVVRGLRGNGVSIAYSIAGLQECIIANNGGHGVYYDSVVASYITFVTNCVIHGNGGSGIYVVNAGGNAYVPALERNIITNNAGIGINFQLDPKSKLFIRANMNAFYANTGGNYSSNMSGMSDNDVILTASPYLDAGNNDYRLNNLSGGGFLVRSQSFTWPGLPLTTGYRDFGAVQHRDAELSPRTRTLKGIYRS